MKLLWIVVVILSRREKAVTGWIRSGSEEISYTQTVSWTYCETEEEAYARGVKYAFNQKPGFSIDQVTVASSDEFVIGTAMSEVVDQLINTRRDLETARASANEAWAEVENSLAKLDHDRAIMALKVAVIQLFADHREDALRTFTLEELAQFSSDTSDLQEMKVEDIYREVLLGTPKPQHPSIEDIIELPTEPDIHREPLSGTSEVGEDIRGA